METNDSYKTLEKPTEPILYKDKNSKFFSYAFPIKHENDVKTQLDTLKKDHHTAGHHCYAYQIGVDTIKYRANDDGEPNNSAGIPIYGQIQSFEITNVLVVVVRYFGGTKLGVSGLINAYKTSAQMVLEASTIIEQTINQIFRLKFDYKHLSKVLRLLKENQVEILKQNLEINCLLEISVRKGNASAVFDRFDQFYGVAISEL